MNRLNLRGLVAAVVATGGLASATYAVDITVNPGDAWLGFMNVSNLPSAGGAYQFGSPWGFADLTASFSGPVLTLSPNTIGDTNEYWYQGVGTNPGGPGAPGNKIMEANAYVEQTGPLSGQSVTFSGNVLANTFTSAHTTRAFIRDFAPDYSSSVDVFVPLTSTGEFTLTLNTIADPARHVQYGFQTVGVNVWVTDTAPFGNIQITAVPEPTTLGVISLAGLAMGRRRR